MKMRHKWAFSCVRTENRKLGNRDGKAKIETQENREGN